MLKVLGVHKDDFPNDDYRKFNIIVKGLLNVSEFVYNSLNIKLNNLKSLIKILILKYLQLTFLNPVKKQWLLVKRYG